MKRALMVILAASMLFISSACGAQKASSTADSSTTPAASTAPEKSTAAAASMPDLSGHSLMIYCGAGMKDPFQKIADEFKSKTGCKVEVTYANAAQIQTQIKTAQEGDMFIAGSADELKPVQDKVTKSKDLVKHIPVLAVKKGNPMGINGITDLTKKDVRVLLADAKSTPIGKIADKALTDFGIFNKVNILARTTTAPAITTSLAAGECDAAIVWKENCNNDKVEIVNTKDLDKYVKTVPAAALSFNTDTKALDAFFDYLNSDAAKQVWVSNGYQLLN